MHPHLDRLFDHMEWADRLVLDGIQRSGEPSEPILRILGHLFGAERIWLMRVRGEDPGQLQVWPTHTLAQCRALAEGSLAGFREVLGRATPESLAAPVAYRTSKGQPLESSLENILLHVALHGAHHRGQIALLTRREGQEPVGTDYITFTRI
jgi:uncharacterized damage-inducible protein DinB